jgi:hypothetical protein
MTLLNDKVLNGVCFSFLNYVTFSNQRVPLLFVMVSALAQVGVWIYFLNSSIESRNFAVICTILQMSFDPETLDSLIMAGLSNS